jgi:hypothetical protein
LAKGNYQGVECAAALIVGRKEIFKTLQQYNSGHFLARIQVGGDVSVLEPGKPLLRAMAERRQLYVLHARAEARPQRRAEAERREGSQTRQTSSTSKEVVQ